MPQAGGYYDIDAILATQQKLPCTFRYDVPGAGYLESEDSHDIKQGQTVDLPYWLAELLALRETLDIGQPKIFSTAVCNALKADPRSVDLRAQSAHFYAFALKYLDWTARDDLPDIVIETFRARVAKLADHAHEPQTALRSGMDFLRGLDENERALFKAEYDSVKATKDWFERSR